MTKLIFVCLCWGIFFFVAAQAYEKRIVNLNEVVKLASAFPAKSSKAAADKRQARINTAMLNLIGTLHKENVLTPESIYWIIHTMLMHSSPPQLEHGTMEETAVSSNEASPSKLKPLKKLLLK